LKEFTRITSTKGINYHNSAKRVRNKKRLLKLFNIRKSKISNKRHQEFNDRNLDQARKIDYGRHLKTKIDPNA